MTVPDLGRIVDHLVTERPVLGLLWAALAVLTVVLLVLTRSRWGQSRTLRKWILLSVAIHAWLACLSTTVQPIPTVPSR